MRTEGEVADEIGAAEKRLQELRQSMATMVDPILDAYSKVLSDWIPQYARDVVVREASVTGKAGPSRRRSLVTRRGGMVNPQRRRHFGTRWGSLPVCWSRMET